MCERRTDSMFTCAELPADPPGSTQQRNAKQEKHFTQLPSGDFCRHSPASGVTRGALWFPRARCSKAVVQRAWDTFYLSNTNTTTWTHHNVVEHSPTQVLYKQSRVHLLHSGTSHQSRASLRHPTFEGTSLHSVSLPSHCLS